MWRLENQIWILGPYLVDPIGKSVYYHGRSFSSSSGLGHSEQAVVIPHWLALLDLLRQRTVLLCIGDYSFHTLYHDSSLFVLVLL